MNQIPSTSNPLLSIRTLGQLEIELNGRFLQFKMSKAAVLLVYLTCQAGKTQSRDQLASLLWSEETDRKARENLRQALYQLRRALGPSNDTFLTISRTTVQFQADSPYQLDATQFEQAVGQSNWEVAAALYQGDFLQTFTSDDSLLLSEWILLKREQLHQLAGQTFLQAAQQQQNLGMLTVAEQYARRLLRLEPWLEQGYQLLMQVLAQQGRRNEALTQYDRCVALLTQEFGLPPTEKTNRLYQQIRDGEVTAVIAQPGPQPPHNLPTALTPLIGRHDELTQIQQQIGRDDCRLLTILGPGGIGKTRLLQAIGWTYCQTNQFPDGLFLVSLLDLGQANANSLPQEIANLILHQLPFHTPDANNSNAITRLSNLLHQRHLLLLLDNWENALAGATLLSELLAVAPHLTIITTSREPLQLHGEWLFELHGLTRPPLANLLANPSATPDTTDRMADFGATELFVQAARRLQIQFDPSPGEWQQIVAICHALEGHPLAIEMAASWLRGLTLSELVESVAAGLDLLTTTAPNIPARHQNLRHVLAYSWNRLTPTQQKALAQLSLYQQPFTRQAAQAVANTSVTTLSMLVVRTWLRRLGDGRFHYHELLRHFAHETLQADPALYQAAQARYIHELLTFWAEQYDELSQSLNHQQIHALYQQQADLEQAWLWAAQQGETALLLKALPALYLFYDVRDLLVEGIRLLAKSQSLLRPLLTHPDPQQAQAVKRCVVHLAITEAGLRNERVASEPVPAAMQTAMEWAKELNDPHLQLQAQIEQAGSLTRLGRLTQAEEQFIAALDLAKTLDKPQQIASIQCELGNVYSENGRFVAAWHCYETSLAYYQTANKPTQIANIRHNLAITLAYMGQYQEARRLHQHNIALARARKGKLDIATALEGLGYISLEQQQLHLAHLHLQAAMRLYQQLGDVDGQAYAHLYLGHWAMAKQLWKTAVSHYRAMITIRQTMDYPHLLNQGWAGLAAAAWQQGHHKEARNHITRLLPNLLNDNIQGEGIFQVYLTAYQVLANVNQEQADAILQQAITQLHTQAAMLQDSDMRHTFLYDVSTHRALLEQAQPHTHTR